jgi:hypothetical protein
VTIAQHRPLLRQELSLKALLHPLYNLQPPQEPFARTPL